MQPIIMHIDMNSYFASCEQQDNPAWRGKPLGVCEHLGGIIIAPSVEAKQWGIKTAMPVWEARKLYPKIILTPTHAERYRFYTRRFLAVLADYTSQVEPYSIDEAFLDISQVSCIRIPSQQGLIAVDPFIEAERIATEIKARIKKEVGDWLRCSVGIASNKLLAKIASDSQKPDGLVTVRPEQVLGWYTRLALTDIPGIASRQAKTLMSLGIRTLQDLKNYPVQSLIARFGVMGVHLHNIGQLTGSFKSRVSYDSTIKSMGHVYTLPKEVRERASLEPVLFRLCEMVATRLRTKSLVATGCSVHIHRAQDGVCIAKSGKFKERVSDGRELFGYAMNVLRLLSVDEIVHFPCKRIGITAWGLQPYTEQLALFPKREARRHSLLLGLDRLRIKYGTEIIQRVVSFQAQGYIRDSVGFGRMKEL